MNSSVFIFIFILFSILVSNLLSPKVYIQPYQRLFLMSLILIGSITALFPNQVAGPLTRLLQINRTSDLIVYLIVIFILAVLNGIYKEIRDLKAKLIRIMQLNSIDVFYKSKKTTKSD
tara:strand:- start:3227 stop:3580 length:354 start_codon:yes stop_codon:yes gene_type:complete